MISHLFFFLFFLKKKLYKRRATKHLLLSSHTTFGGTSHQNLLVSLIACVSDKIWCAHRIACSVLYFKCTHVCFPLLLWLKRRTNIPHKTLFIYAKIYTRIRCLCMCVWCAPMSGGYLCFNRSLSLSLGDLLFVRFQRGVFHFEIRTRNRITNIHFAQKGPFSPTIYTMNVQHTSITVCNTIAMHCSFDLKSKVCPQHLKINFINSSEFIFDGK